MPIEIPEFQDYAKGEILPRLADIRRFTLVADIPRLPGWSDDKYAIPVIEKMYQQLRGVVNAAKFFYEDELKPQRSTGQVGVVFDDDRYDFAVVCSDRNVAIERRGSRLKNFHDWYSALMPSAHGILTSLSEILTTAWDKKIEIPRASFQFSFLVYDITSEIDNRSVRNWEIMQRLLKGFPDEYGRITDSAAVLQDLGRTDVNITRWIGKENQRRRVRFSAEAPANMDYSSLWFTFEYTGESYTSPVTSVREPFDPGTFLTEYDRAYVDFLRDSAINGFMAWLLRNYHFKTTASVIP